MVQRSAAYEYPHSWHRSFWGPFLRFSLTLFLGISRFLDAAVVKETDEVKKKTKHNKLER